MTRTQVKQNIDNEIGDKLLPSSITPTNVAKNMKDVIDLIPAVLTGPIGPIGLTGIQGPSGSPGTTGIAGVAGAAGIQGAAGSNGQIGAQGSQGTQGPAGTNGAAGSQGIQGVPGNNSENVVEGLQTTIQVGEVINAFNIVQLESSTGRVIFTGNSDGASLFALSGANTPSSLLGLAITEIGVGDGYSQTKNTLAFHIDRIVLSDIQGQKGIVYAGDYEANFTARSLITKKYVDTKVPYRVYTARINQSGTSAPIVSTVYENTIGGTITFTRVNVGEYNINFTTSLTANKTTVTVVNGYAQGSVGAQEAQDTVNIQMSSSVGSVSTDGVLYNALIEIRIYNT